MNYIIKTLKILNFKFLISNFKQEGKKHISKFKFQKYVGQNIYQGIMQNQSSSCDVGESTRRFFFWSEFGTLV